MVMMIVSSALIGRTISPSLVSRLKSPEMFSELSVNFLHKLCCVNSMRDSVAVHYSGAVPRSILILFWFVLFLQTAFSQTKEWDCEVQLASC